MNSFWFGRTLLAAATLLALGLSGCGGNSDSGDSNGDTLSGNTGNSASCQAGYTACGGDVVGTWKYVDYCNLDAALNGALGKVTSLKGCENLIEDITFDMGGTITFQADGSARQEFTGTANVVERLTVDCMSALAGAVTADTMPNMCATMSTSLSESSDNTTGSCVMDAGDCLCTSSQSMSKNANTTTTYAVSGNTISLGTDTTNTYCVSGDTLTMAPTDGTYDPAPFIVMTRVK
jgi:hypothetical protein